MAELDKLLRIASRTFAIGIEALPEPLAEEVRTAYLLLRVADYLEDDPALEATDKVELLTLWASTLAGQAELEVFLRELGPVEPTSPDAHVAARSADVYRAYRAASPRSRRVLERHVSDTCLGMARWVARGSVFESADDLDDYMHEVAGRVGYLLTELFAIRIPDVADRLESMMRLGREFGLGLQTVNVIRGLHEDHHRGWIYVPTSFLPSGLDASTLFADVTSSGARHALSRLTSKAERHLEAALAYVEEIPESETGVRVFCLLPLFFAARTLALSRDNPDVFRTEVKMSRVEVAKVTARTRLKAGSNRWARRYAEKLLRGRRP